MSRKDTNPFESQVLSELSKINNRFDKVDSRFDSLETRFTGLETRFDSLETRFLHLENAFYDFKEEQSKEHLATRNLLENHIRRFIETVAINHEDRISNIEVQIFGQIQS